MIKYITRRGLFTRIPIPDKLKDLEPEMLLGRSILDKALVDGCTFVEGHIEDYLDNFTWFDEENPDFSTICYVAYLEPEIVIRYFREVHDSVTKGKILGDFLTNILDS